MDLRSYIILCILTCNSAQLKSHCTFVTARNIYYRTPENTYTTRDYKLHFARTCARAYIYSASEGKVSYRGVEKASGLAGE